MSSQGVIYALPDKSGFFAKLSSRNPGFLQSSSGVQTNFSRSSSNARNPPKILAIQCFYINILYSFPYFKRMLYGKSNCQTEPADNLVFEYCRTYGLPCPQGNRHMQHRAKYNPRQNLRYAQFLQLPPFLGDADSKQKMGRPGCGRRSGSKADNLAVSRR